MAENTEQVLLDKIKTQNEQQLQKSMDDFKKSLTDEYKAAITDALKDGVTPEKFKELNDALKAIEEKTTGLDKSILEGLKTDMQKANDELASIGLAIKGMKEDPMKKENIGKGIGTILKETLIKEGYVKEIEISGKKVKSVDFGKSRAGLPTLELKAAIDMTTALSMAIGSTPGVSLGYVTDYGMAQVQINLTKDTHLIQGVIPAYPTSDKYIGVFVEYEYTDGTAQKDENAAAGKSSMKFKTMEFKVFDIPTYFHIPVNNFEEIDMLEARLNRIANDKILSQIDTAALASTGDNSTAIKGMLVSGNYTEFNPTTYVGSVKDANEIDVIAKMKLQAEEADEDVNIVLLHPATVSRMQDYKDANFNNLTDRRLTYDSNGQLIRVCGLVVVKNKKIDSNEAIVMWSEAAEFGVSKDIEVTVGLENDDLTKRMRTILFNARIAFGVAKPSAIIYSDDLGADMGILLKS